MIEFRVEYKQSGNTEWLLDDVFDSLGEAMDYTTREALVETGYDHRILKHIRAEVLLVHALENFE